MKVEYLYLSDMPACGAICKKKILYEVGLFNEHTNACFEDTDLAIRILKNGYNILINQSISIEHRESNENPDIRKKEFRIYLCSKNYTMSTYLNFPLIVFILLTIKFFTHLAFYYSKIYKLSVFYCYSIMSKAWKDGLMLAFKQNRQPMSIKKWYYVQFGIKKINKRLIKNLQLI